MATVAESTQEHLDLEPISEYIRESKPRPQELHGSSLQAGPAGQPTENHPLIQPLISLKDNISHSPEPDVLETLWPGLHHHDFAQTIKKKKPGFYLIAGFLAGAVAASALAWFVTLLFSFVSHDNKLSAGLSPNKTDNNDMSASTVGNKALTPLVSTYEVQTGDTLAGIALRNYKHISPRLLDSICRANNLSDANVLNLGQKIILPEYTPQQ